jgi:tetratricopeptide (TPR) repeat protein
MQGRLHQATDDARKVSELAMSQGRSEETYNAFIDIAVLNAVYRNDPARGKRYIDSILAARPLATVPAEQRPYLNLAWTYSMLGDVTRARALMADAAAAADTTMLRASEPYRLQILGTIAMAENRPADALKEYRKVNLRLIDCRSCLAAAIGRAFDAAGQPDSAITWSERYLASAEEKRALEDEYSLGPTYRRLGELYEEKGERAKAASYYQKFIDLWRDADADLQPQVAEVKQKLAKVIGEK